jgi:hypothetical protein
MLRFKNVVNGVKVRRLVCAVSRSFKSDERRDSTIMSTRLRKFVFGTRFILRSDHSLIYDSKRPS